MKRLFLLTVLLGPLLAQAQTGTFILNGKVGNLSAPAKAYLRYGTGPAVTMDSTKIENGVFMFKGSIADAQRATLFVDKVGTGFSRKRPIDATSLYLEPGTITLTSPDLLDNAVVSGTPLNADDQKLKAMLKPATGRMTAFMKEYQAATPEQRKDKAFGEAMEKRYETIEADQKKLQGEFIKTNPNSLVSLDALKAYGGYAPDYADVNPVFSGLSDAVKNSKAGQEYAKTLTLLKATSVGSIAPEFIQADTLGKTVALHDFRGKYVLIDFWASWCGPCRAENPNVVKNFQQYKDRNFTILGVSLDQPTAKEAWLRAIHKDNLTWTQVSDLKFWDNEVAKQYGIRSIPQNFLIGPDGVILAKNIRGEELGKKLEALLKEKP